MMKLCTCWKVDRKIPNANNEQLFLLRTGRWMSMTSLVLQIRNYYHLLINVRWGVRREVAGLSQSPF